MAFDQSTRNRLARFVGDARRLVTGEFTQQFQSLYGISNTGQITPVDQLAHLDEAQRATAERLRERIRYLVQSHPETTKPDAAAVSRLAREQAFTVLNRLAALRMAEKRGLIIESVGQGYQSRGFKVYETVAGSGLGDAYHRYRRYLFCLFDELAVDLGVLFDRRLPSGLLFPREKALLDLLDLLNAPELEALWAEDETIGWIYQYYNDEAERKKMREESSAPRNSRELAVRNQFFTPRYVVEFLTDNTLGRLWYEMTLGQTSLKEQCRYLVRRPHEFFLPDPPERASAWLRHLLTTADFSILPKAPPETEVFEFLNHFLPTHSLLPGLGLEHSELVDRLYHPFFGPQPPAHETLLAASPLELVHAMARYAIGRDHDYPPASAASVSTLPIIGPLWDAFRSVCQTPPANLSQEQLLKRPVFLPRRPLKDPREIRLLDPACGSMHFGLYAFDLFERIYAEAWNLGLISRDAYGGDTPPFQHASVRVDRSQKSVHSNDLHHPVLATTARIVLLKDVDSGDGMFHVGPFITDDKRTFRPGTRWDVPLEEFDYVKALGAGWFTPEEGERLVRETPAAWEHDRFDPLPVEEVLAAFHRDVPRLIIEHNLHGIDIDPRAVQIAGLSLWLRAQRAWYEAEILPADRPRIIRSNLVCAEPMPGDKTMLREFVEQQFPAAERPAFAFLLETIFDRMTLAGEAGSLLRIEEEIRSAIADAKRLWKQGPQAEQASLFAELGEKVDQGEMRLDLSAITDAQFWERAEQRIYDALEAYAEQAENGGGFQRRLFADDAAQGFAFIDLCRKRYDVAVMNPPFGFFSPEADDYLNANYPDSYGDFYPSFIERWTACSEVLGAITNRTGLAVQSLERWRRQNLLGRTRLVILGDLGIGVLDALVETAMYVISHAEHGLVTALGLLEIQKHRAEECLLAAASAIQTGENHASLYLRTIELFNNLPRAPIAYRLPQEIVKCFESRTSLENDGFVFRTTNSTNDSFRFLRLRWEVPILQEQERQKRQWIPLSKGGEYQPFFTDLELMICWDWDLATYHGYTGSFHRPLTRPACVDLFFRPGITWSERTASRFSPRVLPSDAIFTNVGPYAGSDTESEMLVNLGLMMSAPYQAILDLFLAAGDATSSGAAARHYQVGELRLIPAPHLSIEHRLVIEKNIRCIVGVLQKQFVPDERSSWFDPRQWQLGEFTAIKQMLLRRGEDYVRDVYAILSATSEIDRLVADGYHMSREEKAYVEQCFGKHPLEYDAHPLDPSTLESIFSMDTDRLIRRAVGEGFGGRFITVKSYYADRHVEVVSHYLKVRADLMKELLLKRECSIAKGKEVASNIFSLCVGVALGRWNLEVILEPYRESGTFEMNPFQGFPARPPALRFARVLKESSPPKGPIDALDDGILVDDDADNRDLERRIYAVLDILGRGSQSLQNELHQLLLRGGESLRTWLRGGFFEHHCGKYSDSQRTAPIYWPLSTASGRYTIWLYYHRITDQTLHRLIADFVNPKLKSVAQQIVELRGSASSGQWRSSGDATRVAELQELHDELTAFRTELERIIALTWRPNLNDGVLITASPLWRLFRLGKWQKDLKACWEALAAGDYDWAHLAYSIWPDRVREKCRTDRSLAIAHGLEELCTVKSPKPKAKRRGKAASSPITEDLSD
jgi:hypothetical protein